MPALNLTCDVCYGCESWTHRIVIHESLTVLRYHSIHSRDLKGSHHHGAFTQCLRYLVCITAQYYRHDDVTNGFLFNAQLVDRYYYRAPSYVTERSMDDNTLSRAPDVIQTSISRFKRFLVIVRRYSSVRERDTDLIYQRAE